MNNYPAPNTSFDTRDDLKIWEIALCRPCVFAASRSFLQKKLLGNFLWLVGGIVLASVCGYFLLTGSDGANEAESDALVFGIAVIVGLLGFLASLIAAFLNIRKLAKIRKEDTISDDVLFMGGERTAQKLIKELEGSPSEGRIARFPVPRFQTKKELALAAAKKSKLNNKVYGNQKLMIVHVASTTREVVDRLDADWQQFLPDDVRPSSEPASILGQVHRGKSR
ncbi:MAG: hypothetical protein KDI09_21640 [Halioglobus sp.]|nr:hypothetical protein [Halioglobus sp.]